VTEIPVTINQPRRRKDTAFQAIVDRVYAAVAGHTAVDAQAASPGQPGKMLPTARLNALAGLLEKLAGEGGHADLYKLSGELVLELDDLLPLVEAGEMLGFNTVQEGDLNLTPLGQVYAEASILARKELIAGRILRVSAIRWIYETLQADDNHRVDKDYFLNILRGSFGDNAESQLDTAVNWGRSAELFAFDDDTDELYLEK
jgi:NitT/TauT family transport system ATP-binding protein